MTKVTLKEKFNTSMGLMLAVESKENLKAKDIISVNDEKYKILAVIMPTVPNSSNKVCLKVEKVS